MKRTRTKKVDEHGIYKYLENISDINSNDLDEYVGPVSAREASKHKKSAMHLPPDEPLPILNTIGTLSSLLS